MAARLCASRAGIGTKQADAALPDDEKEAVRESTRLARQA